MKCVDCGGENVHADNCQNMLQTPVEKKKEPRVQTAPGNFMVFRDGNWRSERNPDHVYEW